MENLLQSPRWLLFHIIGKGGQVRLDGRPEVQRQLLDRHEKKKSHVRLNLDVKDPEDFKKIIFFMIDDY